MNQQIATAAEQQSAVAEEINRSVLNVRDISTRPQRPVKRPPAPASNWRAWAPTCKPWSAASRSDSRLRGDLSWVAASNL
jgi:uncharacterized protein YgbK (DUF1537 family)